MTNITKYICVGVSFFALFLCVLNTSTYAQTPQTQDDASTPAARLELAQTLQDLRPVKTQIDVAIEKYIRQVPPAKQDAMRAAITKAFNYKALEAISVDAYAETYTAAELRAMIAYYSLPEAQSASNKSGTYAGKVYPDIIKMLDKALMLSKTGG